MSKASLNFFKSTIFNLHIQAKLDEESINIYLLMLGYFAFEILFNTLQNNISYLLDLIFNILFLTYLYYYLDQQKKHFFLLFFLIKYIYIVLPISWSLIQFSSLFNNKSIIIDIGLLLHIDVSFINFLFSFFAGFLDCFIFLMYLRLGKFFLTKTSIQLTFQKDFKDLFKNNFRRIGNSYSNSNLKSKLKIITLITVIIVTPVAYTESMQTINDTNDGLYYLTNAVSILLNFFHKNDSLSQIVSTGNGYLSLKNTLYFSAKNIRLSAEHLKSLDSPIYYPFLFLIGANGKIDSLITILNKLSDFIGGSTLDLVGSIQDYLNLMYQLTHEILRRAYWWDLEKYNITYNPKTDFYDKFNNEITFDLSNNVLNFKNQYSSLSAEINNSFLKDSSIASTFLSQMTKVNNLFDQIIYLSKIAPPMLNATFFSVEVTNALAFDQFISAKNLTNLSQKYITQAQTLLANYTFDTGLSDAISNIAKVMQEINIINNNFVNMTANTQNMFLSMAKLVNRFNDTTFNNGKYLQNENSINNEINNSVSSVKQIVDDNINKITGYVNANGNYIRFQFKDILKHFLWFYNGYKSAVVGYQNLWISTNNTLNIFSLLQNQQNKTLALIDSYRNNSLIPDFGSLEYQQLLTDYSHIQTYVHNTGLALNASVTDGALKVNKTMWEHLLGFNTTTNKFLDSGFNKYLKIYFNFWESSLSTTDFTTYYTAFDTFTNTSNNLLQNLSALDIFLSQSEQLPNG